MKHTLNFEVDVEKIAQDLFEKEYEGVGLGYGSIKEQVKREIKESAVSQLKAHLLADMKVEDWVAKGYYNQKEHLTELAKNAISGKLKELTESYIQEWISKNMKWVVEKSLRDTLDKLIVPRLQKMIANMLIVDTENMDAEMRDMEEALKAEAKGAYESGQIAAMEEIRRSI